MKTNRIIKTLSKYLSVLVITMSILALSGCGEDNFSSHYSYDETHHWFECLDENCDEKKDYEEHTFDNGICSKCHYGAVASIGEGEDAIYFKTLNEAVESITSNDATVITLFTDAKGDGVVVAENKNIVFNLNNHSYTLDGTMVGSPGTRTNGFQLRKNATVIFKNGTIKQGEDGAKILIQNYSNLTLENVKLDGTKDNGNVTCLYTLSNNFGNISIKGNTEIIAPQDQIAFDLWYGMASSYDDGVNVTFENNFTGSVTGRIEYGGASRAGTDWEDKAKLTIKSGTFNTGDITLTNTENANIEITGGNFDTDVSEYCEEGYIATQSGNRYIVELE